MISNLNSPSRILKHYFKKLSICFYFNFYFATIPFYDCISNLFLHISLSIYIFVIFLAFAFFFHFFLYASLYHFVFVPFFFSLLFSFFISFCPSAFLFIWLSFYLSIAFYLFVDFLCLFFSTLIFNCPCMSLFSSLLNLILLFASYSTLSKLIDDVTNDHQKLSIAKVDQILP